MHTLIILNPHAAGGRAGRMFQAIEKQLVEVFDDFVVAVTDTPADLERHLDAAAAAGLTRIIAAGGDGTNHAVVNALARRPDLDLIFGSLPLGTGRDWARCLGMPADPAQAVAWLGLAEPVRCDLGRLSYADSQQGDQPASRVFLNIASAGASGETALRVNRARRRTPLTFFVAAVQTLWQHQAQHLTVTCDGQVFYDDRSHLVVVANGQYFGRGMHAAPDARMDDGLLDVLVLEGVPRLTLMLVLQLVYSGRHVNRKDVHMTRAQAVQVHSHHGPLGMEFDGEAAAGQDLNFAVLPGALRVLMRG